MWARAFGSTKTCAKTVEASADRIGRDYGKACERIPTRTGDTYDTRQKNGNVRWHSVMANYEGSSQDCT